MALTAGRNTKWSKSDHPVEIFFYCSSRPQPDAVGTRREAFRVRCRAAFHVVPEKIRARLKRGMSTRLESILKRTEAPLEFPLLLRFFAGLEERRAIG